MTVEEVTIGDRDFLKRVYREVKAIRENLPEGSFVDEEWVTQYHRALKKIEKTVPQIAEYRIPDEWIKNRNPRGPDQERFIGRKTFCLKLDPAIGLLEDVLEEASSSGPQSSLSPSERPLAEWANSDVGFLRDDDLRKLITRDLKELACLDPEKTPKSVVVLCGGIAEGILHDAIQSKIKLALQTDAAKKYGVEKKKDLTDRSWTLSKLVAVAVELKLVGKSVEQQLGPVLKDFRNLIHPAVELREQYELRPRKQKERWLYWKGLSGTASIRREDYEKQLQSDGFGLLAEFD